MSELNLKERKKSIGGSEVAAILGLDEHSSPYKVWLSKTGREEPQFSNKYMEAGVILESAVAEFFQQKTKYRIIKTSANQKTYAHPEYPFATGTPDRLYTSHKVGKGILECKTTQYCFDDIPEKWFIQLQWYLGVVGLMYGSVAWLERGVDFKYKEYEYDDDFFHYLIDEVMKFWTNNVQKDEPPQPINIEDILRMYPRHKEGIVIQSNPDLVSAHDELVSIRGAIKELDDKKTDLEAFVKTTMKDAEAVMSGIKPLFTWRSAKSSLTFNKDKFKEDNPELYEKYLIEAEGSRRFLVK